MPIDKKLLDKIERDAPTLKEIDFGYRELVLDDAVSLAQALERSTSLTRIYLPGNKFGDAGVFVLASVIKKNTSLTSLNLNLNGISARGAQVLAEALETNISLTMIDLETNQIGAEGVQALVRVLETKIFLTSIILISNQIGAEGARALVKLIENSTSLTMINLENNQIGDVGTQALAEAFKTNKSLTSIVLSNNKIGDVGVKALADALKTNKSLTSIVLHSNEIGDAGCEALIEALDTNTSLIEIDLRFNRKIGRALRDKVGTLLARNGRLARPYMEAEEAHKEALRLIHVGAQKDEILASFAMAQARAREGIQKGYHPSQNLLACIERDLEQYQGKKSSAQSSGEEKTVSSPISPPISGQQALPFTPVRPSSPLLSPISPVSTVSAIPPTSQDSSPSSEDKGMVLSVSSAALASTNASETTSPRAESKREMISPLDPQVLQVLRQLSQQQATLSTDEKPVTMAAHAAQLAQYQVELSKLQSQMRGVDTQALQVLQGRERELRGLIQKEQQAQKDEQERQIILANESLKAYYHTFIIQLRDAWVACMGIHSGKMKNVELSRIEKGCAIADKVSTVPGKAHEVVDGAHAILGKIPDMLDKIPDILDKVAEYVTLPGIGLLKDVLIFGIEAWSAHDKQHAVNRMANFFVDLVTSNTIIETLARRLTLLQQTTLQALGTQNKTGAFSRFFQKLTTAKDKLTANDIDTPVKKKAEEGGKRLLEAIMKGQLSSSPATLGMIDELVAVVTGVTPAPAISPTAATHVTMVQSQVTTYTAIQQSLSPSPLSPPTPSTPPIDAASRDEVAALRRELEEAKRQVQEARDRAVEAESRDREREQRYQALFTKVDRLSQKVGDDKAEVSGGSEAQMQLNPHAHPQNQLGHPPEMAELSQRTDEHAVRLAMLEEAAGIQRPKHAEVNNGTRSQLFSR